MNWGLRIFTWFASGPRRFAVAQKFAAAFSRIWSPSAEWMKLPAFTGWGYSKDFPRPAIKTFRDRWVESDPIQSTLVSEDKSSENQKAVESNVSKGQSPKSPDQLITQFQTELETLGGVFIRCEEGKLVKQILTLLDEKSIDTVMAWEDAHLPTGLAASLREKGIAIHNDAQPQIRAGITGATAGIAETGSIVVTSGSGKPQSTSLLPQIHLAILREADLQKDLAEVFKLHKVREAATVSLISGPSKTADIEMTLTVGVHGPGEVYVFFI